MQQSVLPLILRYGVPLVALLLFAGELGVPTGIPIEIALLLAGAYAVQSPPELLAGILLVTAADFSGTLLLHLVARTGGARLLTRLLRRHQARGDRVLDRLRRRLGGRDAVLVFAGRLVPIVRMYVTVGTGLLRVRPRDFVLGAAPAALIWAGGPLALGYVFRASVPGIEARYATASHAFLVALLALGLLAALGWWVRGGPSVTAKVRRVRFALGLAVAAGSVAYLIKLAWANEQAQDQGLAILPFPALVAWLAVLGGLAIALLWQAITDLRLAHGKREPGVSISHFVDTEVAVTVVWASLIGLAGAAMVGIELRYPEL